MTETKPKRRWFRFSLRTLFVLVTIIGKRLGYSFNWIRQKSWYRQIHSSHRCDRESPLAAAAFLPAGR